VNLYSVIPAAGLEEPTFSSWRYPSQNSTAPLPEAPVLLELLLELLLATLAVPLADTEPAERVAVLLDMTAVMVPKLKLRVYVPLRFSVLAALEVPDAEYVPETLPALPESSALPELLLPVMDSDVYVVPFTERLPVYVTEPEEVLPVSGAFSDFSPSYQSSFQ
jgi:hypothetical protein